MIEFLKNIFKKEADKKPTVASQISLAVEPFKNLFTMKEATREAEHCQIYSYLFTYQDVYCCLLFLHDQILARENLTCYFLVSEAEPVDWLNLAPLSSVIIDPELLADCLSDSFQLWLSEMEIFLAKNNLAENQKKNDEQEEKDKVKLLNDSAIAVDAIKLEHFSLEEIKALVAIRLQRKNDRTNIIQKETVNNRNRRLYKERMVFLTLNSFENRLLNR